MKSPTQLSEQDSRADAPGFSDWFQAFDDEFAYVCRTLRRQGITHGDAEDLAQDVLMVVWRRWGEFDRRRPLRPWLVGIAARVARSFLKRRWREVPHGRIEAIDPKQAGEEQVESARSKGLVSAALAALPDRHRAVILLHDFQGLSPAEIAQDTRLPISTVYTRLRRAHLAFSGELRRLRKGPGEPPSAAPPAPGQVAAGLCTAGVAAARAPLTL